MSRLANSTEMASALKLTSNIQRRNIERAPLWLAMRYRAASVFHF